MPGDDALLIVDDAALIERLRAALTGELPGASAQLRMSPRPRREWPAGFNLARVRSAAGLLLLVPRAHGLHAVLTVRAETLDHHRGQVSLPGGRLEANESAEQAAVREAEEEIGVRPSQIRILGALTPIDIPVSGFRLHPIVALGDTAIAYSPAPHEVARVLEVPLHDLLRPDRIVWRSVDGDGRTFGFPAFAVGGVDVWGATAMVLAEFLTILGWEGPHGDERR